MYFLPQKFGVATVGVLYKKVCNFIIRKSGSSIAKFLRTLILNNIC